MCAHPVLSEFTNSHVSQRQTTYHHSLLLLIAFYDLLDTFLLLR